MTSRGPLQRPPLSAYTALNSSVKALSGGTPAPEKLLGLHDTGHSLATVPKSMPAGGCPEHWTSGIKSTTPALPGRAEAADIKTVGMTDSSRRSSISAVKAASEAAWKRPSFFQSGHLQAAASSRPSVQKAGATHHTLPRSASAVLQHSTGGGSLVEASAPSGQHRYRSASMATQHPQERHSPPPAVMHNNNAHIQIRIGSERMQARESQHCSSMGPEPALRSPKSLAVDAMPALHVGGKPRRSSMTGQQDILPQDWTMHVSHDAAKETPNLQGKAISEQTLTHPAKVPGPAVHGARRPKSASLMAQVQGAHASHASTAGHRSASMLSQPGLQAAQLTPGRPTIQTLGRAFSKATGFYAQPPQRINSTGVNGALEDEEHHISIQRHSSPNIAAVLVPGEPSRQNLEATSSQIVAVQVPAAQLSNGKILADRVDGNAADAEQASGNEMDKDSAHKAAWHEPQEEALNAPELRPADGVLLAGKCGGIKHAAAPLMHAQRISSAMGRAADNGWQQTRYTRCVGTSYEPAL